MTRAGREPAEDVKRRLISTCQEVGLVVTHTAMRLLHHADARLIHIGAALPDWPYSTPTIGLMATVPVTGLWPEFIDIRCSAAEGDPALTLGPVMKGRTKAPFVEIVEQLQATLAEREHVIAAVKAGIGGPYRFEHSVWQVVDLLSNLASPDDTPPPSD